MNATAESPQQRLDALHRWLRERLGAVFELAPASADASFRRYFRVTDGSETLIAMDAPPEREDCRPFIAVARDFAQAGLSVPEIHDADVARGFVLMSDLGRRLYLDALNPDSVERLYGDALGALATLQARAPVQYRPPAYDRTLLAAELQLFPQWYLGRHRRLELDERARLELTQAFDLLIEQALAQPVVCVHRDYHSRNLMVLAQGNPGILDFQDAVMGPITYDLVSLLRDCYIRWPQSQVETWALEFHRLASQCGLSNEVDEQRFLRWFDWMGLQRHLKAVGIFARLFHRDGKTGYLGDIPRTLEYVRDVAGRYPELAYVHQLAARALEQEYRHDGAATPSAAS